MTYIQHWIKTIDTFQNIFTNWVCDLKKRDFLFMIRHDNYWTTTKSVLWKYNTEKHQRNSLRIYCISITNMTADFNCITFTNGETSMQRDWAEGLDMSLCVWSCRVHPHNIIPLQVLHHSWETAKNDRREFSWNNDSLVFISLSCICTWKCVKMDPVSATNRTITFKTHRW